MGDAVREDVVVNHTPSAPPMETSVLGLAKTQHARELAGGSARDDNTIKPSSTYASNNCPPFKKPSNTPRTAIIVSREQSDLGPGLDVVPNKPSRRLGNDVLIDSDVSTEDDTSEASSRRGSTQENSPTTTLSVNDTEEGLAEMADFFRARTLSARVVPADGSLKPGMKSADIILPCAPDDDEKVMYLRARRVLLLPFGIIAFAALAAGMSLFTLTSASFYWFGVPTVFLMVYLGFHYFGISIWGKDFDLDAHGEVVRGAAESSFMPTVDIFLPVCNEPIAVLANAWNFVSSLDYPLVTVNVLDDGAKDDVRDLAAQFCFQYVRRPNRPELKKAGNLRYAFTCTSGEVILILDADFCPRPEFLRETLPYFMNPSIGIVQTPQYFRWRKEQTWVEQGAAVTQELFYRMVQVNHDRLNASYCVGTCGVYRRAALEQIGGMAAVAHSEDIMTGFMLPGLGFQVRYVPLVMAMGICPDDPRTFFMQQYRWCMGTAALVLSRGFWKTSGSVMQKMCLLSGMMYYIATAVLLFLAPLPILLLVWLEPKGVRWFHLGFTVPAIIFAALIIPCWSRQPYGMACHRVKVIQRSSSKAYYSSTWLLIVWNTLITLAIVGGATWRMMDFPWHHFLPSIVLAMGSYVLCISTLWY